MTDDARVFQALSAVGIPGTKHAWSVGKAPQLPWFVYWRNAGGWMFADGVNYQLMPRYVAELYVRENDPAIVDAFEDAVRSIGPFTRREAWLDSEGCMQYRFQFTLPPEKEE